MFEVLNRIEEFCSVKNQGPAYLNGFQMTPRIKWITGVLRKLKISYEIDRFIVKDVPMYNVILKGNGSKMIIAHHDIVNVDSDNANDNSASILNAIYLKTISPETPIVFTDSEEFGLWGAKRIASRILKEKRFSNIEWVLNLELTGLGGKNVMVGEYKGDLGSKINQRFGAPIVQVPINDCLVLDSAGINTTVINSLPLLTEGESDILGPHGYLDNNSWLDCHSKSDTLSKISTKEMKEFVEEILFPLVSEK
jgi:hypothetical protein